MTDTLLTDLPSQFPFLQTRPTTDCPAFQCPVDRLVEVMQFLRDQRSFDLLIDVTAIDWSEEASPRFTCVYHLLSSTSHQYLRIAADCLDDQHPEVPSLTALWPAANWHERETYDMFGIRFTGHPDLRRILMWESYPYFPLRKEFPLAGIETELPAADIIERTGVSVQPAPMMGGPFHASQGDAMSQSEPRAKDQSWNEAAPKPTVPDETPRG